MLEQLKLTTNPYIYIYIYDRVTRECFKHVYLAISLFHIKKKSLTGGGGGGGGGEIEPQA